MDRLCRHEIARIMAWMEEGYDLWKKGLVLMTFTWMKLTADEPPAFKRDIQQAFQLGAEQVLGKCNRLILPEKDIDETLSMKGAAAWQAVVSGKMAGGAIVVVDEAKGQGEDWYG